METSYWTPDAIGDLSGRTVLITGAAGDIGRHTARELAVKGARVLMTGRDVRALDRAAAFVHSRAPTAWLGTMRLDLSDLDSVQQVAARINSEDMVIDVLINNAAVLGTSRRHLTTDGFELTFGVNHLGHFALTAQLLPALLRSPAPRVVTVSALSAYWRAAKLNDLMSLRHYGPMVAFAKSKRANLVFTEDLTLRLSHTPIMPLVVHPGAAPTGLWRHTGPARRFGAKLHGYRMGSVAGGAWPSLYAATNEAVHAGAFVGPAGPDQTSGAPRTLRLPNGSAEPQLGRWLYEESVNYTGATFPVESGSMVES